MHIIYLLFDGNLLTFTDNTGKCVYVFYLYKYACVCVNMCKQYVHFLLILLNKLKERTIGIVKANNNNKKKNLEKGMIVERAIGGI